MHATTTVYLGADDLADASISRVFTAADGSPWATVFFGDGSVLVVHVDSQQGANPVDLAACFERLASDLRTAMSQWVATPDAQPWVDGRKAAATAEAIANNAKAA